MTENGPQGVVATDRIANGEGNQNLNRQVVPDVLVPPIERDVIQSYLAAADGNDEDNDDGMLMDDANEPKNTESDALNNMEQMFRSNPVPDITQQAQVEIKLMNIMSRHRLQLGTFQTIMNWAKESQNLPGFDFRTAKIRKREVVFKEIQKHVRIPDTKFQPKIVTWLPDKKPAQIYVRDFRNALYSLLSNSELMCDENLSFPSRTTPLQPDSDPAITDETYITELHHGTWWTDSWKSTCQQNAEPAEILVPLIFYMDGISLDAHGRLSLTPLNMTLGIFSVETRKRPEAWTTIYFHPDSEWENTHHSRKATATEGVQNIHNAIAVALESLREIDAGGDGILWDYLPYAGKVWSVRMKFAIAYVVGDTELHDKLCGKYGSRSARVKKLCRHCDCATSEINKPAAQQHVKLWKPDDFEIPSGEDATDYFKQQSHHRIQNAFHSLNFGSNLNNIHLATPGETLHMHQLGVARRCVEAIEQQLLTTSVECKYAKNVNKGRATVEALGYMAQRYGALLSRQSDRDFPKTKFGTSIMSIAKKEGKDYGGMLLCILVALASEGGQEIVGDLRFATTQIDVIEQIISMEEFLKHGRITPKCLRNLPKTIIHFINTINTACHRKGMGTRLIKNHLYFHIPEYIKLWGHPLGWDSSFSESHHKTEVKAPAKNTQQNAATLISQTTKRQTEKLLLRTANVCYGLEEKEEDPTEQEPRPKKAGSLFKIHRDATEKKGTMTWHRTSNKEKPFLPSIILDFVCDSVLPLLVDDKAVEGFTEHNRWDSTNKVGYLFRCHPSYRSTSGQVNAVWMDWALMSVDSEAIPCQILCFLELENLKRPTGWVNRYPIENEGLYAVVRKLKKEPRRSKSRFVSKGILDDGFFLFNTDAILSDIAVVPELNKEGSISSANKWLVVANRSAWLDSFEERNEGLASTSYATLYSQCPLAEGRGEAEKDSDATEEE